MTSQISTTMSTARREALEETRRLPPEVGRIIDGSRFQNFRTSPLPQDCSGRRMAAHSWAKVDHVSRMPDDILQLIVSLFPMREAVATSVLSLRWRNLWTISLPCLNFEIPNMLGHDYPKGIFKKKTRDYVDAERSKFTKWVNNVITQMLWSASSRVDALRVSFILNKDSASDIDRWIMSSVARGATEIHLDFNHLKFFGDLYVQGEKYEFPAQLVGSTVRYLYLKLCKLNVPPDFTGFASLVSLSLDHVRVTQSLMENILLSKCPLLEFLSLASCDYPTNSRFKFAGKSLRLKHLHIASGYDITSIELHDINLLSFELGMNVPKLSIQNAPYLERLVLLVQDPVNAMSNTPRLETLSLAQSSERPCAVPQTYVLNNLKRLQFIAQLCTTNLLGVVRILEACHLLQILELDMGFTDKAARRNTRPGDIFKRLIALPGFPLSNLKEVEIYGFEAYLEKVAFAKYLLNNAVVLEKMGIYTTTRVYCGNGRWVPWRDTACLAAFNKNKKASSLEKVHEVHKELQHMAGSSTKIELFSSLSL